MKTQWFSAAVCSSFKGNALTPTVEGMTLCGQSLSTRNVHSGFMVSGTSAMDLEIWKPHLKDTMVAQGGLT